MRTKTAKAARRPLDQYYTPDEDNNSPIDVLLRYMPITPGASVLEPCCGTGNLVRPLERHGLIVTTNDIDYQHPADYHFDYLLYGFNLRDYVVSNPPFNLAAEILRKALAESRVGVALYLRVTFGEPTKSRSALFDAHPPRGCIIDYRRSFTGDGKSDSTTCAWYIWRHDDCPPFFYISHNPNADPLGHSMPLLLGHEPEAVPPF